jgi:hypothetical protein
LELPDSTHNPMTDSAESDDEATSPRDIAVGLALYTASAAWNSASTVFRKTRKLTGFFLSPVKRVADSSALEPVRTQFELLQAKVERGVDKRVQIGLSQEPRAREAANKVVDPVLDGVVGYLSSHPAIKKLVEDQIAMLAKESPELPELNVLVQVLVNNYITYLNQNPQQVQNLLNVQSRSMIEEIADEVRERLVTGDSLLEALARGLFRRRPRAELPGPPAEVQAWGLQAFLPGDFRRLEEPEYEDQ